MKRQWISYAHDWNLFESAVTSAISPEPVSFNVVMIAHYYNVRLSDAGESEGPKHVWIGHVVIAKYCLPIFGNKLASDILHILLYKLLNLNVVGHVLWMVLPLASFLSPRVRLECYYPSKGTPCTPNSLPQTRELCNLTVIDKQISICTLILYVVGKD